MGCNDVSEFEHIYGQILTTPSCVYGRLFTWTSMVDFNALIVLKTFIDICVSIRSSFWALIAAYTKFGRMIWSMRWSCAHWSVVTFPDVYCYLVETPGDLTGEKLKAHNFVISGWIEPLQVLKRNSGHDSHDATSPSSFPPTFAPFAFLRRVWGYHKLWN